MLTQGEDILVFQLGASLRIHLHWFDQLVLPGQNLQPIGENFLLLKYNENYKFFTEVFSSSMILIKIQLLDSSIKAIMFHSFQ